VLAALLPLAAESTTPAEEGRDIIIVMLIVGLVIIAVIALGELTHWLRARR
jgi:hypothetical protein